MGTHPLPYTLLMKQYILFILLISLTACQRSFEKEVETLDTIDNSLESDDIKIHWSFQLDGDDFWKKISVPDYKNDHVYFASQTAISITKSFVYKVHMETGEIEWKTELDRAPIREIYIYKRVVVAVGRNTVYLLDTKTGDLVWSYNFYQAFNYCLNGNETFFENYIYVTAGDCNNPIQQFNKLLRVNLDDLSIEHLLEFKVKNEGPTYFPLMNSPLVYKNADDETTIAFSVDYGSSDGFKNETNFYSYNLDQNTYNWQRLAYNNGNKFRSQAILFENRIYIVGNKTITCFDERTGAIIWQRDYPSEFVQVFDEIDPIVVNNTLVINSIGVHAAGFDPENGQSRWHKNWHINWLVNWAVQDGYLIGVDDEQGFFIMNAATGVIQYNIDPSPLDKRTRFREGGIMKHPTENNNFFFSDSERFMRLEYKGM